MNRRPEVLVVLTGIANTASVLAGLERAGANATVSEDADKVRSAEFVVLPGVGAFGAGMERLSAGGLAAALRERIESDLPTLGVCLGMQLFATESEESPGVKGLGIFPALVKRFSSSVRCPQLGWNEVVPDDNCRFLSRGYAYFANSFRLLESPPGWSPAWADYDGPFLAAAERGSSLVCQFHPELSGQWGLDILKRWLGGN